MGCLTPDEDLAHSFLPFQIPLGGEMSVPGTPLPYKTSLLMLALSEVYIPLPPDNIWGDTYYQLDPGRVQTSLIPPQVHPNSTLQQGLKFYSWALQLLSTTQT